VFKGVLVARDLLDESSHTLDVLTLDSTNILRKFLGIFDIIFSGALSETVILNFNVSIVIRGLIAHWSQFVWYRLLFILFSRYSYLNTFTKRDAHVYS
jgi:N-acetylglucosaminylphosphatidylinositol deacetylase